MSNAPTVKVLPWIITDFHWLWSKGRVIYRPRLVCQAWHHVITRLLKDYKIRMRTKQRGKKQSKASVVEPLKKWHATFREQSICALKAKYNPKWVVFYQYNVWVLINHFVRLLSSQRRCEFVKKGEKNHNTWISQPGSGMDKWQCSLQILYHPEGKQLKLGINFCGKGRVVMDEKLACHKSINVFFQTNAWINIRLCRKWIDTTLSTFVLDEKLETVVLLDNISCQELDGLKEKVSTIKNYVGMVRKRGLICGSR